MRAGLSWCAALQNQRRETVILTGSEGDENIIVPDKPKEVTPHEEKPRVNGMPGFILPETPRCYML